MCADHRVDRTKRVKDAKTEAQKEIDEYKKKKEEEFKKYEAEVGWCMAYDLASILTPSTETVWKQEGRRRRQQGR